MSVLFKILTGLSIIICIFAASTIGFKIYVSIVSYFTYIDYFKMIIGGLAGATLFGILSAFIDKSNV